MDDPSREHSGDGRGMHDHWSMHSWSNGGSFLEALEHIFQLFPVKKVAQALFGQRFSVPRKYFKIVVALVSEKQRNGETEKQRNGETEKRRNQNLPVWYHRSSDPSGPLPKRDRDKERQRQKE